MQRRGDLTERRLCQLAENMELMANINAQNLSLQSHLILSLQRKGKVVSKHSHPERIQTNQDLLEKQRIQMMANDARIKE